MSPRGGPGRFGALGRRVLQRGTVGRNVPRPHRTASAAAQTLDLSPAPAEFPLKLLEAPVQMVNAIDDRLAFACKAGNDERYRSPEIGRHDGRALERFHALD